MTVRVKWSLISSLILTSIALLTIAYILTGINLFWYLAGVLFWLSLPLLWPRLVRFEENALILEWGWPKVVFRRRIPLEEIREIINVSSAERLRLIRYMKDAYLWLILWLSVGILGLLRNTPPGPYIWGNWVFWGTVAFIREIVPIGDRLRTSVGVLGTALLMALVLYRVNPDYAFYFAAIGVLMALIFADEENKLSGILIVTDDGSYMISPLGGKEHFLNGLSRAVMDNRGVV